MSTIGVYPTHRVKHPPLFFCLEKRKNLKETLPFFYEEKNNESKWKEGL